MQNPRSDLDRFNNPDVLRIVWETVPGSLHTVGEAVRISRNAAAHDTKRKFSKAEVALLLGAMPTQLEMIANLTELLENPPPKIGKIKI